MALNHEQLELLGSETKKTIIFEAELLALVLAFSVWRDYIRAMSLICFVDNNSARDVAISGNGRNIAANCLIEFLLKLEMQVVQHLGMQGYPHRQTLQMRHQGGQHRDLSKEKFPKLLYVMEYKKSCLHLRKTRL